MPIRSFAELRRAAREHGSRRLAVVAADDDVVLTACAEALKLGLARPILFGDAEAILARISALALKPDAEIVPSAEPAAAAVKAVRDGRADILLKGHLRTDQLLHAVLDRDSGLRTGRLLSDVLLYEDTLSGTRRLVAITDGGLNVAPSLEQKKQIVLNAISVMRSLGIARPKIALMSASEAVSEAMPSTLDAQALTRMADAGEFGNADVFGPLALDNALLASAAAAKGIRHPVAGAADCMVAPSIEAGNLLGKSVKYYLGSQCAHVVVGARAPILIPSRVESTDDKVNAIALGIVHGTA
ncbi:MAG TPA: phosphate acyltransferase [Rhizomicrobium sp.]|nr:phosphate acyltransferase [Rhizomicrobium sp.]